MLLLGFIFKFLKKKFKQVLSRLTCPSLLNPLTRPTCPTCPTIQNSKFKIHNLPIPFALFRAHYRFKKRLSLWCIKENNRLVFCIMLIFNVIKF